MALPYHFGKPAPLPPGLTAEHHRHAAETRRLWDDEFAASKAAKAQGRAEDRIWWARLVKSCREAADAK